MQQVCPKCQIALQIAKDEKGFFRYCKGCGGRSFKYSQLGGRLTADEVSDLTSAAGEKGSCLCPSCCATMDVIVREVHPPVELDRCSRCQLIWADKNEVPEMGQDAHAAESASKGSHKVQVGRTPEVATGKFVTALLGFPVELDRPKLKSKPIALYSVILGCLAVFIYDRFFVGLDVAVEKWGFMPSDPFRGGMLTVLRSLFMHGGWFHIIGNLYFLRVFGDDVEEDLGTLGFLFLILASHLAAIGLHSFVYAGSSVPLVGASGAVFGVMGYYMLRYPYAKIGWVFWVFLYPVFLRVSAVALVLIKLLHESALAFFLYGAGGSGIAHMAHIGGAIWGIFFAYYFKNEKSL